MPTVSADYWMGCTAFDKENASNLESMLEQMKEQTLEMRNGECNECYRDIQRIRVTRDMVGPILPYDPFYPRWKNSAKL